MRELTLNGLLQKRLVPDGATSAWSWWLCCHGGMGEREEYYDRRAAEYESITAGLDAETAAAFA